MTNVKEDSNDFIKIIKGSLFALVTTLIILSVYATLLTYTNINENTMPAVILVSTALSILLFSQITFSKIKKNGAINGAMIGTIYILVLYLISSIITKDFSLNKYSIIMIILSIAIGSIGGVIGVNRKN